MKSNGAIPVLNTAEEFDALLDRAAQEGWTDLAIHSGALRSSDDEFREMVQRFRGGQGHVDRLFWLGDVSTWAIDNLAGLTRLQHLCLIGGVHASRLRTFTDNLHQIPGLVSLTLKDIYIGSEGAETLAANLHRMPRLSSLRLQNNSLGEAGVGKLADKLRELPELTSLDLGYNKLGRAGGARFAANLHKLPGLTSLSLRSNSLGEKGVVKLADNLQKLRRLAVLDLGYNDLGEAGGGKLLTNLRKVPLLVSLDLEWNRLGVAGGLRLADNLQWISGLVSLDLRSNGLGETGSARLADSLGKVPHLASLDLSYNRIGDVGLGKLADNLHKLPRLASLDLEGNNLFNTGAVRLAASLHKIPELTSLGLRNNHFGEAGAEKLADNLRHIPGLISLGLGGNGLGEAGAGKLADNLHNLPRLASLDLEGNDIGDAGARKLADAWHAGRLRHLQTIVLLRNTLAVPDEILESRSPAQIFASILKGTELHEARIVVLGDPEAGKTWLCERVFQERRPSGPRNETHDFELHQSRWKPVFPDGQTINLTAWDFGGQYVLHGVHEMFLTRRSIPLIVVDATKTQAENHLTYWLRMVRHFLGRKTPLILVVSKNKERRARRLEPLDVDRLREAHKLARPIQVVEDFDVANDPGIDNLKTQITATLAEMKELRDKLSPLQRRVKARVEREFSQLDPQGRRKAMIPPREFAVWCGEEAALAAQESGFEEEPDSDILLRIVHNFGSLFFFGNTETEKQQFPRRGRHSSVTADESGDGGGHGQDRWLLGRKDFLLHDWLIHPHWLKWPLYHITRESENVRKQGVLAEADIDKVLSDHPAQDFDVPDAGRSVVKAVLLLTELCHYNEEDGTYLFPRGLPENGEAYFPSWYDEPRIPASELNWFFFPEAAFHRLVVRWFPKIPRKRVWRFGMVIQEGDVEALVRAFPEEGKVTIDLHGGSPDARRDLYRDLRRDLDFILGRPPEPNPPLGSPELPLKPALSPPPSPPAPIPSIIPLERDMSFDAFLCHNSQDNAVPGDAPDAKGAAPPFDRDAAYRLLSGLPSGDFEIVMNNVTPEARQAVRSRAAPSSMAIDLVNHYDVHYRGLHQLAAAIRKGLPEALP